MLVHQGDRGFIDVIPIGFSLSKRRKTYCSQFFEAADGLHELIGCLFNYWVIGDRESQTKRRKQLRRFLSERAARFKSEPFLDLKDCIVNRTKTAYQFTLVVDEDSISLADRFDAFFELTRLFYDPIPEWCLFLKSDCEQRLPVDYIFYFVVDSSSQLVPFSPKPRGMGQKKGAD